MEKVEYWTIIKNFEEDKWLAEFKRSRTLIQDPERFGKTKPQQLMISLKKLGVQF